MGYSLDLRDQMNSAAVENAFSALVSGGKMGYKTVIERKVEPKKCPGCNIVLRGEEKFCPECGTKIPPAANPVK